MVVGVLGPPPPPPSYAHSESDAGVGEVRRFQRGSEYDFVTTFGRLLRGGEGSGMRTHWSSKRTALLGKSATRTAAGAEDIVGRKGRAGKEKAAAPYYSHSIAIVYSLKPCIYTLLGILRSCSVGSRPPPLQTSQHNNHHFLHYFILIVFEKKKKKPSGNEHCTPGLGYNITVGAMWR